MSTHTHTECPSCGFFTPNKPTEYFCCNDRCIYAKERWNGGYIRLRNPTTGQTGSVVAFANIRSAFAKGFIHLEAPAPAPAPRPVPPPTPAYVVVGYAPVHPVIIIRR